MFSSRYKTVICIFEVQKVTDSISMRQQTTLNNLEMFSSRVELQKGYRKLFDYERQEITRKVYALTF